MKRHEELKKYNQTKDIVYSHAKPSNAQEAYHLYKKIEEEVPNQDLALSLCMQRIREFD